MSVCKEMQSIELFINSVREHPVIYNSEHSEFKNLVRRDMAWKKIQAKTGVDVTTLKAKWRNLRDTYNKYKNAQKYTDSAAKKYINWRWAEHMSFIDKDIESTEFVDANATKPLEEEVSNSFDNFHTVVKLEKIDDEENEDIGEAENGETVNKSPARRRRTMNKIFNHSIIRNRSKCTDLTKRLVDIACDRIDMEFLGFANSLKSLPLRKQAIVKLQIANIITEAQLEHMDSGGQDFD